jgi:hypothetical protein
MGMGSGGRWLLLLHQIPSKPAYLRAKVLRRLNQLGALAVKNSAYMLPSNDETLEDFQWLRREIEEQGAEAWLFATDALSGLSDQSICEAFRALRAPDYAELIESGHRLLNEIRISRDSSSATRPENNHEDEWRKIRRRHTEVHRIDFFDAPGSEQMEVLMNSIDRILHDPSKVSFSKPALAEVKGRTWVTRRGVKVDRIASAWLIRRCIDPAAQFLFVDPANYSHGTGEIRFDMFEGEFTHDGDLCTFEVLLGWSANDDPALRRVAEVVHDIDLKDGKYQRPEAAGIASVIEGIALRHSDDSRRLEEGATLFEALYTRARTEHP